MNNYSKIVAKDIENMKEINPESLMVFKEEALKSLTAVNENLKSEDPLEREEAMMQALEIKALLEAQLKSLAPSAKKKKTPPIHLVG